MNTVTGPRTAFEALVGWLEGTEATTAVWPRPVARWVLRRRRHKSHHADCRLCRPGRQVPRLAGDRLDCDEVEKVGPDRGTGRDLRQRVVSGLGSIVVLFRMVVRVGSTGWASDRPPTEPEALPQAHPQAVDGLGRPGRHYVEPRLDSPTSDTTGGPASRGRHGGTGRLPSGPRPRSPMTSVSGIGTLLRSPRRWDRLLTARQCWPPGRRRAAHEERGDSNGCDKRARSTVSAW